METAQSTIEQREMAVRFEALLDARPERRSRIAELWWAFDVSAQTLRLSCEGQLGMRPADTFAAVGSTRRTGHDSFMTPLTRIDPHGILAPSVP